METSTCGDRKLRSMSDSDCFVQRRASLIKRLRTSMPVTDEVAKETPEEYEQFTSPIPVHQMYSVERAVAAVRSTKGAFSSVKIVRETSTGHLFAAKITCITEENLGRMAIKEFQTLSELSHCNIIKPTHLLIDLLVSKAYMFMPILTETTLSDVIAEREEGLDEYEVREIARQVTSALVHIHAKRVIHRDINPNNIMYAEGKAVLIDFQTCTRLDPSKWMMSTVGTGAYSAPEMKTSTVYK